MLVGKAATETEFVPYDDALSSAKHAIESVVDIKRRHRVQYLVSHYHVTVGCPDQPPEHQSKLVLGDICCALLFGKK